MDTFKIYAKITRFDPNKEEEFERVELLEIEAASSFYAKEEAHKILYTDKAILNYSIVKVEVK